MRTNAILFEIIPTTDTLGDESYFLEIDKNKVHLKAQHAAGLFRGLQTIYQLMPPEIYNESKIEGIGRPRVEPSFIPGVVDEMRRVADTASVATMHWLEHLLGRKAGPSTGTNLYGALQLASEMKQRGETGSIVTLLCDSGDRYLDTYYSVDWVQKHIGDLQPYLSKLQCFEITGKLS